MKGPLFLAVCSLTASCSLAANILVVFPIPAFSHFNGYAPIFKELARRGNNVTVVSPFPLQTPMPNYTDIVIPNTLETAMGGFASNFGSKDIRKARGVIFDIFGLYLMCPAFLDPISKLPELTRFINEDKSHFDLILTETIFCLQPFHALSHKYNAPVIALQPLGLNLLMAEYTKNPLPITYMIHPSINTDSVTLLDKARSAFYFVAEYFGWHLYFKSRMEKYMRDNFKYPGSENLPPLDDLLYNISFILLDNHIALSFPTPYLPNVAEIGGLSIKEAAPLPQDLETFMKESKDGVVFFTWGSHYKSTNMKPEVLSKFLSVFSKLKQRVLFKWENETLPGKPQNVRFSSWFPQASILAHPNLRVFISHCGIHGISEAVYHGVPVLATPIFGDQEGNAKRGEKDGYVIKIDIDSFSEQQLLNSINNLIYDPKYKKAALRQSAILRDRPLSALDTAVYWIEYVIRHSGAHHLKPSYVSPPWKLLLLMALPYLATALAAVLIPIYCIRLLFSNQSQRPKQTKQEKNKNKKQ